ncbi:DsbA family protein [Streptomyces sp. H34-S4]|uniref:DsbA family protein n=1 Tax=Streptomyces sp. H34-S4 TaxID=2996463 RepID=UPI002D1E39F7|nr:DsbA family protein [Streptomyces sp. H34-S4]
MPAFGAIQNQRRQLTKPEDQAEFFAIHGVDKEKYLATCNSFAIKGQVDKTEEPAKKAEITGGLLLGRQREVPLRSRPGRRP